MRGKTWRVSFRSVNRNQPPLRCSAARQRTRQSRDRAFRSTSAILRGSLVVTVTGRLTLRRGLELAQAARTALSADARVRSLLLDVSGAQLAVSRSEAQLLMLCLGRLEVPGAIVQSAGHGRLAAAQWWEEVAVRAAGQHWTVFSDLKAADAWTQLHVVCGRACGE